MKLPKCSSYLSWTDFGYEYDCNAVHGQSCEDCLCTYNTIGGLWHPETGKRVGKIKAMVLYGRKNEKRSKPWKW